MEWVSRIKWNHCPDSRGIGVRNALEYAVNHTGIMLLPGDLAQFIVKLISVFADQIFWVLDVD